MALLGRLLAEPLLCREFSECESPFSSWKVEPARTETELSGQEGQALSPNTTWQTSLHWTGIPGHVSAWIDGSSLGAQIFVLDGEVAVLSLC